ncbi:MAG: S8 family peptidase [Mobilitalea sp.]
MNRILYLLEKEKVMTQEEKFKIINNEYMDLIIKYNGNPASLKKYEKYSVHIMNEFYAVIYLPLSEVTTRLVADFGYSAIPKCYSLSSEQSLEASGVTKLRRIPAINLRGQGVVVGIIDTGIDYTNPVFQHEDGSTKIVAIWDQTMDSKNQYSNVIYPTFYGTEYTSEQINQALKSENPLQVVPSMDEIGHGTMLAGIAAGSENKENNFSGVVPDAELIIVKLKEAKQNIMNFYSIPKNVPCYQENDIIWALQYMVDIARRLERPLAICIGLGTSQGAHNNSGPLNTIASLSGDIPSVAISVSAGNEGNSRRHFFSFLKPGAGPIPVELYVGENEPGFSMELWGDPPMIYTLDILSPTGEYIPRILESLVESQSISFFFEQTVINIDYIMIEEETGKQIILLRFKNPTQGNWRFQVYGRGDLQGAFHIWLPSDGFISGNTYFLNPNPYTTITSPGNSTVPITLTAYNINLDTLYLTSGKGYSTSNTIKPDLASPGVNIQCPTLYHGFTNITGTGAAAAHTTGIAAMILEWSIVDNNYPGIDTVGIKKFLIRGAKRSNHLLYPNRDWGFGIIDVYNSFNILRTYV